MGRTTEKKQDKKKKKDKDVSLNFVDAMGKGNLEIPKSAEFDSTQYRYGSTVVGEKGITIDQIASIKLSPDMPFGAVWKGEPSIISSYIATPSTTLNEQIELQHEITKLKRELGNKIDELNEVKGDKEKKEAKIRRLEGKQRELLKKENLMHLIGRVNEKAREKLFVSKDFANLFDLNDVCKVVVMSIDIRRSTELMLKAREPKLYAEFITSLCKRLTDIIISNFGVFDKFTGDGILSFFPYFYSGPDATYYALKSADECHKAFSEHYEKHRHCFSTILKEVGLGIGIDFGDAYLTNINSEITVVGNPVVYACRFSGAEHGKTFLNQPAYEEVKSRYHDICQFKETDIKLKHEGRAVAYRFDSINYEAIEIDPPDWDKLTEQYKRE